MKKLSAVVMVCAGLLTAGAVYSKSQDPAAPSPNQSMRDQAQQQRLDKLSQELNLTEDQKAKVQATFDETRQKIEAAIDEARTNADAQLQQILTPQQYQKLQSMWHQHQQQWQHGGSNTNQNSGQ